MRVFVRTCLATDRLFSHDLCENARFTPWVVVYREIQYAARRHPFGEMPHDGRVVSAIGLRAGRVCYAATRRSAERVRYETASNPINVGGSNTNAPSPAR